MELIFFFDNVGGDILNAALMLLNHGSRVVLCGGISQYQNPDIQGPKNYLQLLTTSSLMQGFIILDYKKEWPQAITEIIEWIKEGKIIYGEHIIDGLEQTPKVLPMLFTGDNEGKLIIKISDVKSKL